MRQMLTQGRANFANLAFSIDCTGCFQVQIISQNSNLAMKDIRWILSEDQFVFLFFFFAAAAAAAASNIKSWFFDGRLWAISIIK